MVLIARALAGEPDVLVLDEPETGLDFRNQLIVLDLIDELVHRRGLVAVMNTHYPSHALRVADQVLMLSREHEAITGPTADTVTTDTLGTVFGVNARLVEFEELGTHHSAVVPVVQLE